MRISDWSSDVCSSDLVRRVARGALPGPQGEGAEACARHPRGWPLPGGVRPAKAWQRRLRRPAVAPLQAGGAPPRLEPRPAAARRHPVRAAERSEEHTSELQSLMRISYAVFCLKKKNKKTTR